MYLSPKIDGIRATVINGKLVSRSLIEIPNKFTQALFGRPEYEGLDGELVVGKPNDPNLMQQTSSGVMSIEGEPDVKWFIFDRWNVAGDFQNRLLHYSSGVKLDTVLNLTPQILVSDATMIASYEEFFVNKGFEGVMLKAASSPYKQGRSTVKEGYMVKVKRFVDSEAEIIDFVEQQTNTNEATLDERGYTKRSHAKAGKEAAGILGTIIGRCVDKRDPFYGKQVEIGTGLTAEQRKNLWEGRKHLIGKIVKYKYFPKGCVDKPRHPVFLGFRDRKDM